MKSLIFSLFSIISFQAFSIPTKVTIQDTSKHPLNLVMVTQKMTAPLALDTSDDGYPAPNIPHIVDREVTKFTNKQGQVSFDSLKEKNYSYRLRKYAFQDQTIDQARDKFSLSANLFMENDPIALAKTKPANIWLGALNVGSAEDKIIFQMQCGFCHQQGTEFTRQERSVDDWRAVIKRMIRYGSRLPSEMQKNLPPMLVENLRTLRENPKLLAEPMPWQDHLANTTITEWPVGDSMSQTHDMLVAKNKLVYVADNIQDRLYEVNPETNAVTVYKIPHLDGDQPGGLISARLKDFPKHDSTSNAHSLTESKVDGHIFITPSAQKRLIEFDPESKKFTIHFMEDGFYPHTIRMDSKDNVWFTLALSNQVARFNRKDKTFTYYDLPARTFKEKIITQNVGLIFKIASWGIPLNSWLHIDRTFQGTPLVYGIDVTPDDKVWVARLHTNEIGSIDPETGKITMIKTPFWGPRRMRTDKDGNLWITSFGESKIAKFTPSTQKFEMFDLPVIPTGSETPYSINVDKPRDLVWVTGNQSNSVFCYDIKKKTWKVFPLPRTTTFTRDFEFDDAGNAYTSNSNFPSWHIEDAQPTLIKIEMK